jgi:hypothetical protein
MEEISNITLENIKELEEIYNYIKEKVTNKELIIEFKLNEKLLGLIQYIFPKIIFKKMENTNYRAIWNIQSHNLYDNDEIYKKIMSINYII